MSKVAFITGATRGIGRAIALELAKEGYNIALNYRTENEALETLKKEISELGVECYPVQGDVSKAEDSERITKDNLILRMKEEEFTDVINVNLVGTFNITKNVIKYMTKKRYGKIINISSVVGISGNAGQSNYAASKAGIIGFTKSIAKELASRNITANAVAPGFIQTDMTNVLKDEVKEAIEGTIPLKRLGTAEDVAKVVKFLASDDSNYITGQVINVDGGMLM